MGPNRGRMRSFDIKRLAVYLWIVGIPEPYERHLHYEIVIKLKQTKYTLGNDRVRTQWD